MTDFQASISLAEVQSAGYSLVFCCSVLFVFFGFFFLFVNEALLGGV